jgi:ankyrin repeat protein
LALLLDFGADPNERDEYGDTPLAYAAGRGQVEAMRYLIARGAKVRAHGSPLVEAAYAGKIEAMRLLISLGADVNRPDEWGICPLHAAVYHPPAVQFLLEAGADQNIAGMDGNTALHYAASYNQLESARLLLEHGADPSRKNLKGEMPYQAAERHSRAKSTPSLVELLEPGASH